MIKNSAANTFAILAGIFLLISVTFLAVGCSKTQKVIATEANLTTPYDSLGQIEIEKNVHPLSLARGSQQLGEWVTFGWYQKPSQAAFLKEFLDKELVKVAKKRYGAEAVIQVQYWPALNSEKFPKGKIYAKGKMIKYKRFAS